jgi:hypothetical protein
MRRTTARGWGLVCLGALIGSLGCEPEATVEAEAEERGIEETASRDRDAILTDGTKLYTQGNEELVIRHFFNDQKGGFFLDIGSSHWRHTNTTYYLEKHLGWSGIAVDARDEFAKGYKQHRPRSRFFSFIVTDHSGSLDSFYRSGVGINGDLSSTVEGHVKLFPVDVDTVKVELPTITLNDLLDQNGVTRVDFLSMDIEQGEPAALAGFEINRFQPQLVCIEATESVREPIIAYFAEHNYEHIQKYLEYDRVNWYYRPNQPPR